MPFNLDIVKPGETTPERKIFDDGSYIIGRGSVCKIRLPYPEISERHALLSLRDGKASFQDLRSANGSYVNGIPAEGTILLSSDSIIQIGDCMMRVSSITEAEPMRPVEEPAPAAAEESPLKRTSPSKSTAPVPDPMRAVRAKVKEKVQAELVARLNLKRLTAEGVDREGLERQAKEKLHEIIMQVSAAGKMPPGIDPAKIEQEIFDEALRLGPLEELLADDTVTEIMVNGPQQVYIERHGKLQLSDLQFMDEDSVMAIIERIVSPIGRRIDESQPYVDARLPDGSRVNAIIPPLSLSGPSITIRKFAKKTLTVEDFIRFGTWNLNAAEFMRACVLMRKNVIVAGGTGSGKTTLLNLLSGFIPEDERIVTVEDAAELRLVQPHVVRLEARPPNIEGKGAVTIRDLVKNCLRMRPDRIIVGECRGGEALDMLQAMNTGHDGSLTTVHANSSRDVIARLETMVLMSGMELPSKAIREQIASAVDIIIQESRMSDGSRKIVTISEVVGMEGPQIVMQDIFEFRQTGVGMDGKVLGVFRPTGAVPSFFENLKSRGIKMDPAIFDPLAQKDCPIEIIGKE